eukprot:319486-Chlamydomonas_euryale.AAC.2
MHTAKVPTWSQHLSREQQGGLQESLERSADEIAAVTGHRSPLPSLLYPRDGSSSGNDGGSSPPSGGGSVGDARVHIADLHAQQQRQQQQQQPQQQRQQRQHVHARQLQRHQQQPQQRQHHRQLRHHVNTTKQHGSGDGGGGSGSHGGYIRISFLRPIRITAPMALHGGPDSYTAHFGQDGNSGSQVSRKGSAARVNNLRFDSGSFGSSSGVESSGNSSSSSSHCGVGIDGVGNDVETRAGRSLRQLPLGFIADGAVVDCAGAGTALEIM